MSVSSRSPTTRGRSAPIRSRVSSKSGRNGLPATTSGRRPAAVDTAATSAPLPGAMPAGGGHGQVEVGRHPGHATGERRRRPRPVAASRRRDGSPGPPPPASPPRPRREPGHARATRPRGPPLRRREPPPQREPGSPPPGPRPAPTSRRRSLPPRRRARCRWAATDSGVRAALLVTNASVMPSSRARRSRSGDALDRIRSSVDDAVQVEHRAVVTGGQRLAGRLQRRWSWCHGCLSCLVGPAVAVRCSVADADLHPQGQLRLRPFAAMRFNPARRRRHRRGDVSTVRRHGSRHDRGPAQRTPAQHRAADPAAGWSTSRSEPMTPTSLRPSG